jgi:hypothetical protein
MGLLSSSHEWVELWYGNASETVVFFMHHNTVTEKAFAPKNEARHDNAVPPLDGLVIGRLEDSAVFQRHLTRTGLGWVLALCNKRCLIWTSSGLAILLLVAAMGWISNANSKALCQQRVGSWLYTQAIGGEFFYLLDPNEDEEVRATFRSIDAPYSVLTSNSHDSKTWPRLAMKTHSLIPFVISVDYFWEREAEIGGGATKWFVCFFGKVVEIGETNEYAT